MRIEKVSADIVTDYPIASGPYKIKRLNLEKEFGLKKGPIIGQKASS